MKSVSLPILTALATLTAPGLMAKQRRLGIYAGQVDGILGPDTSRAIEDYQVKNKLPVTGQPNQGLNALLGIF